MLIDEYRFQFQINITSGIRNLVDYSFSVFISCENIFVLRDFLLESVPFVCFIEQIHCIKLLLPFKATQHSIELTYFSRVFLRRFVSPFFALPPPYSKRCLVECTFRIKYKKAQRMQAAVARIRLVLVRQRLTLQFCYQLIKLNLEVWDQV